MGPWFGFVTSAGNPGVSQLCWAASHAALPVWAGGTRSGQGTQPGQQPLPGQRGIPYHIASCSPIKAGREEEEGRGDLRSDGVCRPKSPPGMLEPRCPGMAEPRWPVRSGEWIPCSAVLACVAFALLIKPPFISAHQFSHFSPSDSRPRPAAGWASEWL